MSKYFFLALFCFQAFGASLPTPRFVSIRSKCVNAHVGPGPHYPLEWTYVRQNMPIEVIAEFDMWRQVRDLNGAISWIHKSLLSGRRYVWINKTGKSLKKSPRENASVVAYVQPSVIGKIIECQNIWCSIEVRSPEGTRYKGWIEKDALWGIYPHETTF